ncbi:MAG: hypothetical protein ACOC6H_04725 [Thermoproteota archaeon]
MSEIKIKVPSGIPEKIAKFELERQLSWKKRKMKGIKSSIEKLDLTREDVKKFEEARGKAWESRKKKLL